MAKRLASFAALFSTGAAAPAHDGLALGGTLHRVLHVIGVEGLVATGGALLAIAVGMLVRHEGRKAARRRGQES